MGLHLCLAFVQLIGTDCWSESALPCLSRAAASAAAASSSTARPQAEVASHSACSRYQEGTRVLLTSKTRRGANDSYVWLRADVHRTEETSRGTAVYMREVGGRGEEFRVVVPHHETVAATDTNASTPVLWDDSKTVAGFGEDLLASVFSFLTPPELFGILPPHRSAHPSLSSMPSSSALPSTTGGGLWSRPINGETTMASSGGAVPLRSTLAPAKAPATAGPRTTPTNPFSVAEALTGPGGGHLFGVGAASGGDSMGGASSGTDRRSLFGQGGGAFMQHPSGGATHSSPSPIHTAALGHLSASLPRHPTIRHAAPVYLFGGNNRTQGRSLFTAAKGSTGGGGAAGRPFSGAGRGNPFGQSGAATENGEGGMFCSMGVAAVSVFSRASGSTRGSMFGGAAFRPQPSGGAIQSMPSHCKATAPRFSGIAPPLPPPAGHCVDVGEEEEEDNLPLPAPYAPPHTTTPAPATARPRTTTTNPFSVAEALTGRGGGHLFGVGAASGGQGGGAAHSGPSLNHASLRHAALYQYTHVAIDSSTAAHRQFWESMRPGEAFQLGKWLVNLTALTLVQPRVEPSWCLDKLFGVVEGHAEGRREAHEKDAHHGVDEGSLEVIEFTTSTSSIDDELPSPIPSDGGHQKDWQKAGDWPRRRRVAREHFEADDPQCDGERGWSMPGLAIMDQDGWAADKLGRFISSSRSLQHVGGSMSGGRWAVVVEHFPKAAVGQRGPLSQLRSIGRVVRRIRGGWLGESVQQYKEGVERLQIPPISDCSSFAAVESVDRLINECCVSPDIPISVSSPRSPRNHFSPSIFYADYFDHSPARASPFIKRVILQEASRYFQCDIPALTHRPVDSPSQSAIEIAQSLDFTDVGQVEIRGAHDPPPGTPAPTPAIIEHLPSFPDVGYLSVRGALVGPAGRLLAAKMPIALTRVLFDYTVDTEDRRSVLEGLGRGRHVHSVSFDGPLDDWASPDFPSIGNLSVCWIVPDDFPSLAATQIIHNGVTSLVNNARGLICFHVTASPIPALVGYDAPDRLLPERLGGFTIVVKPSPVVGGWRIEVEGRRHA
ncbi:unnamed protein product [Vitrella brassicaformis CCMP3155]|uniref:START domain-containing protein n=1 Tax=Vitrella brassicaformis (strain CCMP3155) TaxID=1169540 RepID=A0A0G4H401_VITBC|nr:unnamed protein product [Vitrella brassicaformis CCMP3155]|eukprot:CEM38441.1 unnamed protein product [Vitrella brassicaformis CCMP3155]